MATLLTLVWRDTKIDHQVGDHDDWANAAVGAVVAAAGRKSTMEMIPAALITKLRARDMQRRWRQDHGCFGG